MGATGVTGATGSITANLASYYTPSESSTVIKPGQTAISFLKENTRLGSNITVSDSTITVLANGTYLVSVSGIIQEPTMGAVYSNNLSFTVGLQEETGENPFSNVQPFPLAEYNFLSPGEVGEYLLATTFNVLQMITVNNAPVVFNVLLNNNSGVDLYAQNQVLNIVQLD